MAASSIIPEFIPDNQFKPDEQSVPGFVPDDQFVADEDKYSTTGQQIKTAAEGAAEGVAGPLAPLAETKLLGVNPEDIRGRAKANPVIHGASEAAGLVGGAFIPGLGEYTLGSKVAEAGLAASKLATNVIARGAIRTASEMALLQASDETSKWLMNDPNQTIQSAISNIGLSAALGGIGGAAFTKAGQALRSLGDAPEEVAAGIRKGLDPFTGEEIEYTPPDRTKWAGIDPFTKKPLERSAPITFEAPISPKVESSGVGDRIAQAIKDHSSEAGLEGLGAGIGAAAGHATGIPGAGWIGAYLGKEHLAPILKSIIPALGTKIMDMAPSGPGFAAVVNAAEQAIKGRVLLEKVANSVFGKGIDIEPVGKQEKNELDAKVRALQNNPQAAQAALNQDLGHYAPDHAVALGQTVGQAVQYLNSQRPVTEKQSPLDSIPVPNQIQKSQYDRALELAQQPLAIMKNIKEGNLTSTDIKHVTSMYPALYEQMKTQLLSSMTDHLSRGRDVPYKTRLGLSLFMGQPLDSSMKPQSILASQPPPQQPQQIPGGAPGVHNRKHSTVNLDKLAKFDATPSQAREAQKITKG